jgi:hypothetical protein
MGSMKYFLITVMVLGFVCAPAWLQADDSLPVIKGIRVFKSGDDLGVEISADKNFEYTSSKMPPLLKVVVDMPHTKLGRPDTVYKYKSIMISSIQLEKKTINYVMITRISINLTEDAVFLTQSGTSDNKKLTLLLRKPATGSAAGTIEAIPKNGEEGQPAVGKPAASVAPAPKIMLNPVVAEANQSVTVTGVNCGADSIEIKSGGNISEFKVFTLRNPGRLVVDIPDAQTNLRSIAVPANRLGVLKARIGLFEGKLRMVFDTGSQPFPGYEVVNTGTGLRIVLRAQTGR